MNHHFNKHYTPDEARALLPEIRQWLDQLDAYRERLERFDERWSAQLRTGQDMGGQTVNQWVRTMADMQALLAEFERRRIQIKDLARGLVDFPAIIGGREVFLCWERGEEDIEFWHDLDSGYTGRERL